MIGRREFTRLWAVGRGTPAVSAMNVTLSNGTALAELSLTQ